MYITTDSTWTQAAIFFSLLFVGMVIGLVFAFISGEKQYIKKKIWRNIHDIIFCIIMFLLVGLALYMVGNGKIQMYMVWSIILGFCVSKLLFEKSVKTVINKGIQLIKFIKVRLINRRK